MQRHTFTLVFCTLLQLCSLSQCPNTGRADDTAEMQKRLNAEVLNQGFDVKREGELNAYIEEATRKGLVPKVYSGPHWRYGYTCGDLLRYSWAEYRDCMYYYRYYGWYYPYP